MEVKTRVINLDKVLLKLESLEDIDLEPVLKEVTNRIKRDAKINAPVDTGDLRASISSMVEKEGQGQSTKWIGRIYTNLEYAKYQEFGTSKMKAQPYLLPAYKANKVYADKAIKSALKYNIKRLTK